MLYNFIVAFALIIAIATIYDIIRLRIVIRIALIENWINSITKIDMIQ